MSPERGFGGRGDWASCFCLGGVREGGRRGGGVRVHAGQLRMKEELIGGYVKQIHTSFEYQMDKSEVYHSPTHIRQSQPPCLK